MAGVSKQKQKLLVMEQLFRQRTDETHAITGNQLIDILGSMGIKAERKTIYDDIATLCDAGLDIETTKIGHSNAYYMGRRLFDDEELKVLADTVASSKYLTIKKSNEIIKKLQALTSDHKAPMLRRSVHIENRSKSFNDSVYRTIDAVQEAILSDRVIEFTYSDKTAGDKKKNFRRMDETTAASPYQIVWENERYYIICRCEDQRKMCRYRAEKMTGVVVTDRKRTALTEEEELELRKLKSGGEMTEGTTEELRIRFDSSLLEAVYERFGDKTVIRYDSENTFCADVSVSLSPEFWGWLFAFGDMAKIISPQYAAEIAEERLEKLCAIYK